MSSYIFTFKSLPSDNDTIQDALEHGYFSNIELIFNGPDDKCQYAIKQLATIYNFIAKMLTNDYYDKCVISYGQVDENPAFNSTGECKYWVNPIYERLYHMTFPNQLFNFTKTNSDFKFEKIINECNIFVPELQLFEIPVDPLSKHLVEASSEFLNFGSKFLSFGIELLSNKNEIYDNLHTINVVIVNNDVICIYAPTIRYALYVNKPIYEKYLILKEW